MLMLPSRNAPRLRADHACNTPDAIQLATALHAHASHFLTNEQELVRCPDLTVLLLDSQA